MEPAKVFYIIRSRCQLRLIYDVFGWSVRAQNTSRPIDDWCDSMVWQIWYAWRLYPWLIPSNISPRRSILEERRVSVFVVRVLSLCEIMFGPSSSLPAIACWCRGLPCVALLTSLQYSKRWQARTPRNSFRSTTVMRSYCDSRTSWRSVCWGQKRRRRRERRRRGSPLPLFNGRGSSCGSVPFEKNLVLWSVACILPSWNMLFAWWCFGRGRAELVLPTIHLDGKGNSIKKHNTGSQMKALYCHCGDLGAF